jgi:hypothetical protein
MKYLFTLWNIDNKIAIDICTYSLVARNHLRFVWLCRGKNTGASSYKIICFFKAHNN